jgi:hypothetical protein
MSIINSSRAAGSLTQKGDVVRSREKKKENSTAYSHSFEFFKHGITTHMLGLGK